MRKKLREIKKLQERLDSGEPLGAVWRRLAVEARC